MKRTGLNKTILLGYISPDGKPHQSGAVYDRGGISPTEYAVQYKEPQKVVRKWTRK